MRLALAVEIEKLALTSMMCKQLVLLSLKHSLFSPYSEFDSHQLAERSQPSIIPLGLNVISLSCLGLCKKGLSKEKMEILSLRTKKAVRGNQHGLLSS